ncbi:MAG: NAD(P)H-quinone oxidoreductase [Pseudomonadales bacterium]|nr:NAD(P)H-quinone oxidoreductase [Pseudomonadales bacterium]MBO6565277.1 NAD(P)H-quinone oxidoreductase [Pseudomonadales bacterium]MBO6596449.1 NAD(P)H-quinone oxidoreductase [Pseudomonadales bacterium]MBO6657305.1 NAD(P)H-quinone oxidoreductase [Pseudomonadales bacterium]MBO6704339.1 NAD(P)H-quinone oxidoreductase [Pseudomonadales bacterium]
MSWAEFDAPSVGPNDVLIRIHATAINRADLMQRRGFYPPPPGASPIMGLECAGEVIDTGADCTRYQVGDRVCALLAGGGYSELAAVHEGSVLPIPAGLSDKEGAALPEVFATAWLNLFMEAGLQPGEKVIIHAGASGVGTTAIQLCKAFGSPCFVTLGSEEKLKTCLEMGAAAGAVRHDGPFLEAAQSFADGVGIDVILDPVGAGYFEDNLKLLGLGGRLVLIGLMSGTKTELDLAQLMMKRARVIGSTLRARPVEEKAEIMAQLEEKVWPKIESGEIKPVIEQVFPIAEVSEAHELVASDKTTGKVVLAVES